MLFIDISPASYTYIYRCRSSLAKMSGKKLKRRIQAQEAILFLKRPVCADTSDVMLNKDETKTFDFKTMTYLITAK